MQLSHFVKIYPYPEKTGHVLAFSTKKASKLLLNEATLGAIEKGSLTSDDQELLSKMEIIVPDREEEKKAMRGFLDSLNASNSELNFMIVMNLDCNFACKYCFEGDMKGNLYLNEDTEKQLVSFIKNKYTDNKKSLNVDFYGGEPLLSLNRIKSISHELKTFVEQRGGTYHFTLVTNGSLFKRKIVEELVQIGLSRVKITLDGPPEIHNLNRPFKSGAESFTLILENLKATCDLVRIEIGGNYDQDSYPGFIELFNYLEDAALTPERIPMIKFDPIMKQPADNMPSGDNFNKGCLSIDEPWLKKAELFLREEILKRGYFTPKPTLNTCMIELNDAYVINYDGTLYKCPAFIGRSDFAIGSLKNDVKNNISVYKTGLWKNSMCMECEYLPLCFGGCRYMSFIRDGNIETIDCRRDYYDTSLETLVKQDIQFR